MITASPHPLLDVPSLCVRICALEGTADIVAMLARVMRAEPRGSAGGIGVFVHASAAPPPVDGLFDDEGPPASWKAYCVRDRVVVRESPSRRTYLCGVPGYPDRYPTAQVQWHLASFIAGGLLTLLSDRLLLLHAALIANGDAGHVLAGPSGAGKSTAAARVPPPWRGVADDMLAVVATEDGYALMPLPTWSVFDRDPAAVHGVDTGRAYVPAGVWFLEQSAADGTAPLSRTGAVQRLVNSAITLYGHYWSGFAIEDRVRLRGDVFAHATRIVEETPCGVLQATRDGRFWEHLRAG